MSFKYGLWLRQVLKNIGPNKAVIGPIRNIDVNFTCTTF